MQARRSTIAIPHRAADLQRGLAHWLRPRRVLRLSEWADAHRVLTSKASGEPGRWRTERTPYLREIMDRLSAHDPTQRVVLRFGAQLGKTEVGLNWIGYVMTHAPAPMLVVVPTIEVRKRWVRQRLDPLLQETPEIAALFDARSMRDAGNSEDIKDFPAGMLVLAGGNSPASLASMPIQNVLCYEVDRFPWEAGHEGDPLGLVEERTNTFPRRKLLLISTPTTAGLSRIDDEYEASDRRQYLVACPHCGERQALRWEHPDGALSLDRNRATGEVRYRCHHCNAGIAEQHKGELLAQGHWQARSPERKTAGYALSQLYSPLGLGRTWAELLDGWERAAGDTAKVKRFVNTSLGEAWQEEGDSLDPLHIMGRMEVFDERRPGTVRAAGVDVQKDRLECTIIDVGEGEETWVQEHLILPGDTALREVWGLLAEELRLHQVQSAAIDSGFNTSLVFDFCQSRGWCFPIKGIGGAHRPLVEDEQQRRRRLRHRNRRGAPLYLIGTDQAKVLIYSRAKLAEPGPGYLHFPQRPAFDAEYFAQLAAEKLVTKFRGHRAYSEWVPTRSRNEALDCLIYALAAYRLSGRKPTAPGPAVPPAAVPPSAPKPTEDWVRAGRDWM
jgi:phage terminase large subunit GpA-like protein